MLRKAKFKAYTIEQSPRALPFFKNRHEFAENIAMHEHCQMNQTRRRLIVSNLQLQPTKWEGEGVSLQSVLQNPKDGSAGAKQFNRYGAERPVTERSFTVTNRPLKIGPSWQESVELPEDVMRKLQGLQGMKFPEGLSLTDRRQQVADVIPPPFAERLASWVLDKMNTEPTMSIGAAEWEEHSEAADGAIEEMLKWTEVKVAMLEPTETQEEEYRRLRAHREDEKDWPGPDYSNARDPTEKELDDAMSKTGITDREDFSEEQKSFFRELFRKYFVVWDEHLRASGPTRTVIRPTRVVHCQPRPERNPEKLKLFQEYIYALAKQGSIRPSSSAFSSPAMVIPKPHAAKDPALHIFKRLRLVCDYKALNAVSIKDRYCPPTIDTCLGALQGSTHRSYLDLTQAFYQVPLKDDGVSIESTAINVPGCGSWEWLVTPMGIAGGPASLQRHMDRVIAGYALSCAIVFADDLCVFSKSWDQHEADLTNIFERLKKHGCSINLGKSLFVKEKHVWLGYSIQSGKVAPNPSYIEAISTLRPPTTMKQLRSVLGVLDQLRRFIKNYASRTLKLSEHVKDEKFKGLSEEAMQEFKQMKEDIVKYIQEDRALYYPKWDEPLRIRCDASKYAIGMECWQEYDSGPGKPTYHPIRFFSRKTKAAEQKYCETLGIPMDKDGRPSTGTNTRLIEAMAIVAAIDECDDLIKSMSEVLVENDHRSLAALARASSGKLLRWSLTLSRYPHVMIRYHPGKWMNMADALSRLTEAAEEAEREEGETAKAAALAKVWKQVIQAGDLLDEMYESMEPEAAPLQEEEKSASKKRRRTPTKRDSIQYRGSSNSKEEEQTNDDKESEEYKPKAHQDESRPDYSVENAARLNAPEVHEVPPL
eukprot:g2859.t1